MKGTDMTHEATAGRFDPRWLGWLAMAGRHHHGRHRHGDRNFWSGPMGFGGGPGGSWGGRGPRARRGDVRAALLTLLAEEPRNGYQLMQEIERRSEGVWRPSPGSVYPALQQLEDEGLIRSDESEGRKQFHLTDAGREAAAAAGDEGAPWDAVSDSVDSDVWELFGVARQVGMAIFQLAQAGTPDQIAQAREVLTNARRALYGILAEDETDPTPPQDA
jgi:DNA-binding PadR family transcriptional regulator